MSYRLFYKLMSYMIVWCFNYACIKCLNCLACTLVMILACYLTSMYHRVLDNQCI